MLLKIKYIYHLTSFIQVVKNKQLTFCDLEHHFTREIVWDPPKNLQLVGWEQHSHPCYCVRNLISCVSVKLPHVLHIQTNVQSWYLCENKKGLWDTLLDITIPDITYSYNCKQIGIKSKCSLLSQGK